MRTLTLAAGLICALLAPSLAWGGGLTVGSPVIDRPINDSSVGVIYLYLGGTQPVFGPANVTDWSFYDNDTAGLKVTPLIYEVTGASQWKVVAIGTTRVSTAGGVQVHPFQAIGGSATLQAGKQYGIGFTHRGYTGTAPNLVADAGNGGVVDFTGYNDFTDRWAYAFGVADLGTTLGGGGLALDPAGFPGRIYSCSFALDGGFPAPVSYCTAGTSTNSCVPSISGVGWPSASASSGFTIQVANVEGAKQGLIFYGTSGRTVSPWGATSFLCVKAPTQRMTLASSGGTAGQCNGSLAVDWLAYLNANPFALGAPFVAGETLNAQAWYRDPPAAKTTNLSNALEFATVP